MEEDSKIKRQREKECETNGENGGGRRKTKKNKEGKRALAK